MAAYLTANHTDTFVNRGVAGSALAKALKERGTAFDVVLGLTRGGVPVAFEVAAAFHVPLEVIAVKKLRAPFSPELAIGAICADGTYVLRTEDFKLLGVTDQYAHEEMRSRLQEARDADRKYRADLPPADVRGKTVLLVDDGIATGSTMQAAVLSARQRDARRVVVAVPVASHQACEDLARQADEAFCLNQPVNFWGVGQFYDLFPQVGDDEVVRLLRENREALARKKSA